jgi:hypothetical protein
MAARIVSEEEEFYGSINRFAKENSTEIALGVAYAKYSFWRAIFCSPLGQVSLALIILGLYWVFGPMGVAYAVVGLVILTIVRVIVAFCRLLGSRGFIIPTLASLAVLYGLVQVIGWIWY